MTDWAKMRALFPSLERCTYLNTAGGGPLSRYAAEEAKRYYEEQFAHGDTCWNEWLSRVEEVRQSLADMIHAEPEEIAFVANCSAAMNLMAQMFRSEGQVITMADDFPSVTLPWLLNNFKVIFVAPTTNGGNWLADLEKAFVPEAKYLVTSFVQYASGFRSDLSKLGNFCKAHNLTLIVDATQGFGVFPIDVKKQKIDILTFSGYKWANAGYGIAPLFVRKELLATNPLPACGWRSAKIPYDLINDRLDLRKSTVALELGHPPFPGIFALRGALRLIREIEIENIANRVSGLTEYLREKLRERAIPILSSDADGHCSGITLIANEEPTTFAEKLKREDIFVSARGQGVRVSLHYYNNYADIDRFIENIGADH